jgi:hypothetical protein
MLDGFDRFRRSLDDVRLVNTVQFSCQSWGQMSRCTWQNFQSLTSCISTDVQVNAFFALQYLYFVGKTGGIEPLIVKIIVVLN